MPDGGGLELTAASFTANSDCPNWPDAEEATYVFRAGDAGTATNTRISITDKINENTTGICFLTNVNLSGTATLVADGKPDQTAEFAGLSLTGSVYSTGNEAARCPAP